MSGYRVRCIEVEQSGKGWILVEWLRHWTPRILRGWMGFVLDVPAIKHRHGRHVKRNKAMSCGGVGVFAL